MSEHKRHRAKVMRERAALVAPERRAGMIAHLARQLADIQSLLVALRRLESRDRREARRA